MNDKFDELAKGLAQSVTRRGALKKFGFGFAGVVLASLGLTNKAHADPKGFHRCHKDGDCPPHEFCVGGYCTKSSPH
jgi:hypothetical protein